MLAPDFDSRGERDSSHRRGNRDRAVPRYVDDPGPAFRGGLKASWVAGFTYGADVGRLRFAGKIRPGALTLSRAPSIIAIARGESAELVLAAKFEATYFELDVGGLAEVHAGKRFIVRADAGDGMVWYRPKPED